MWVLGHDDITCNRKADELAIELSGHLNDRRWWSKPLHRTPNASENSRMLNCDIKMDLFFLDFQDKQPGCSEYLNEIADW